MTTPSLIVLIGVGVSMATPFTFSTKTYERGGPRSGSFTICDASQAQSQLAYVFVENVKGVAIEPPLRFLQKRMSEGE